MNEAARQAIREECLRQEESCLYTSTILYLWLRRVRTARRIFIGAPLVLGGVAGLSVIQDSLPIAVIVLMTFLAGLFPALESSLKFETDVEHIARQAGEYKSLQDRFRRIRTIDAEEESIDAQRALEDAMASLDAVRSVSITPPEKLFKLAKKKIDRGDYSFAVDQQTASTSPDRG